LLILLAVVVAGAAGVALTADLRGSQKTATQQLLDATNGPDIQVSGLPGVDLRPLTQLPGLSASSGPFPDLDTSLVYRGREVGVRLEGRPKSSSVVDHPLLSSGGWVRPGGIVLERDLARRLHVVPGDRLQITKARGKLPLVVSGTAATVARERYPSFSHALAYVLPETLRKIVPNDATYGSTLLMRLSPEASDTLVEWVKARFPSHQVFVRNFRGPRPR
jgi:putative ABC transport system permease protein